ncbi:hypothetical protein [Corynebacterium casei]|uniref:hypothetical protein n=1 Tax=Corynebacterium casei TaxID=160386 RepID=UPI003FD4519B
MVQLATNGMTYREIGEKFALQPSTVGQIVRELRPLCSAPNEKTRKSVKHRHSGKAKHPLQNQAFISTQERNVVIMQLNRDGYSHREIGEHLGLKRDTIKKIVQNTRKDS